MTSFRIRQAADLLGVSDDTVHHWADSGRLPTVSQLSGRRAVEGATLARFSEEVAAVNPRDHTSTMVMKPTRNRFTGLVTEVVREAADELRSGPLPTRHSEQSVRRPALTALATVAAAATLLTGCGSTSSGASSSVSATASAGAASSASAGASASLSGQITVLAAASLTGTFTAIGKAFEAAHPDTKVVFGFGASSTLATQITSGAPADVFASASAKNMDQVVTAKAADGPTMFAKNVMEIAVPPANPAKVAAVADLARAGVKVALCAEAVPCGSTARKVFTNAKITVKPVTDEVDVKATLSKVQLGEVDAGVVYVTDVLAAGSKVKGITIPADVNASTSYPIATLTASTNTDLAKAFVDYVLSPDGASALTGAGFEKP